VLDKNREISPLEREEGTHYTGILVHKLALQWII